MKPEQPEPSNQAAGLDSIVVSESRPTASIEPVVIGGVQFTAFSGKSRLPYLATLYVAFIPSGITIGAETIARLVAAVSTIPRTQEGVTRLIHDVLRRCLSHAGVLVRIDARHGPHSGHGGPTRFPIVTTQAASGHFEEACSRSGMTILFRRRRGSLGG